MGETGKYKVSDLVKETGLARTTINDWLQRYGQYLTYEIQGKRKLYTDHAVAVLKEIAELRNAGQNSFEIDNSLAARHPVRAEVTEEPQLEMLPEDDEEDENIERHTPSADQEFALIAKKQTDEIARMIGEQLRQLNQRLETIERSERNARRANVFWAAALVAVMLLFAVAGIFAFRLYDARNRDVQMLIERQNQTSLELEKQNMETQAKQRELQNLTVALDRNSKDYEKNVRKLQADLERQRDDFARNLRKMSEDAESKDKLKEMEMRDKLAAEQLALLKRLYETAAADSDRNSLLPSLQQNNRLLEEMDKIRRQIEEKSKAAVQFDAAKQTGNAGQSGK